MNKMRCRKDDLILTMARSAVSILFGENSMNETTVNVAVDTKLSAGTAFYMKS